MKLSQDADLLVCCAYKEYLSRRKNGIPKRQANIFHFDFKKSTPKLAGWLDDDYLDTIRELKNAGFAKVFLDKTFVITEQCIIYMENRFINGMKEVADFVSKFRL